MATDAPDDLMRLVAFERRLHAFIQDALAAEAALCQDPAQLYEPSPGQTMGHVHYRVAAIAARAVMPLLPEMAAAAGA